MPKSKGGEEKPSGHSKRTAKPEEERAAEEPVIITDKRASREGLGLDETAPEPQPQEAPPLETEEAPEAPPDAGGAKPSAEPASVYGILALFFQMLVGQAWVALGIRADPYTNDLRPNLEEAAVAIDTAAFVRERLAGQLSPDEKRLMDTELSNLRINFVRRKANPET